MAQYPAKPWSDGQTYEVVPGETFVYDASQATWVHQTNATLDSDYQVDKAVITADISTLQSSVSTAESNITAAQGDITTLQADVATAEGNITTLQSDVTAAEGDITTLQSDVSSNTSDIATNAANIATNTSDIATNTSDIAANTSDIATNTSDIAANASDIAANTSDIATNAASIATAEGNITQLQTDVDAAEVDIISNASGIASVSNLATILSGKIDVDSDRLDSLLSRIGVVEFLSDSEAARVQNNIDRINTAYAMLDSDGVNLQALRTDLEAQIAIAGASVLSFNTDTDPNWTATTDAVNAKTGAIATLFGTSYQNQDLIPNQMAAGETSQFNWAVTTLAEGTSAVHSLFDDSTGGFFAPYDSDNVDVWIKVQRTLSDHDWVLNYVEMTVPGTSGPMIDRTWVEWKLVGIDTNNVETDIQYFTTPADTLAGEKVKFTVNSANSSNNGVGWKGFKLVLIRNNGRDNTSTIQELNLNGYRIGSAATNPFVTFTIKGDDGNWSNLKLAADNIAADSEWILTQTAVIDATVAAIDTRVAAAEARLDSDTGVVQSLQTQVDGLNADVATNAADIATAQSTADGAVTDAATAQSAADAAQSTADGAVTDAATAQSAADAAQSTANTGVTNAATAQTAADAAQSSANTALTNAATAQSTANTGVANAATAQAAADAAQAAADAAQADADANAAALAALSGSVIVSNTQPTGAENVLWVNLNDGKLYYWNMTSEVFTEIVSV